MNRLLAVAALLALGGGAASAQDAKRGATLFQQRCGVCHAVSSTAPARLGPHLDGVVGRKAGTVAGYNFSPAMKSAAVDWDEKTLSAFLENPRAVVAGNRMPFAGLPNAADRADIVEFLKTQK